MKDLFAYIRVSTPRQGEQGVSLPEQRDVVERFAQQRSMRICRWFEDRSSAAKPGRLIFLEMMAGLRAGLAQGVVIHNVDRSSRNWHDFGELLRLVDDLGLEVHFAGEGLDLSTRGGRLTAQLEVVLAEDYSRNLRNEVRKGFYGRLKQGFYPRPAPLGYIDQGGGKAKSPCPVAGALVRQAFELYSTGRFSLRDLSAEMRRRGLRNKNGQAVRLSALAKMLHNPFYMGLMRIRGEVFEGQHERLVSPSVFHRVQTILSGKTVRRTQVHDFLFRRLLRCARCQRLLIGELKKGHVYYRCHSDPCRGTCLREEVVADECRRLLRPLQFSESEERSLTLELQRMTTATAQHQQHQQQALTLQREQNDARLQRLTDAFLDGTIERQLFLERKTALLMERRDMEERQQRLSESDDPATKLREWLELAKNAYLLYERCVLAEKRELLEIVMSNLVVDAKTPMFTLAQPFAEIAGRYEMQHGGPSRVTTRTATWAKRLIRKWRFWLVSADATNRGNRVHSLLADSDCKHADGTVARLVA